ncbi:Rer1 family-domain-containing protein [Chytriomyces sp. MP71]|nr:Rer1 family-domain-containing protein [Chytriomyces sp. MP71]
MAGEFWIPMGVLSMLLLGAAAKKWQPQIQKALDATAPFHAIRWTVSGLLLAAFILRVFLLQAFALVTYFLGIHLLSLFLDFIKPKIDPALAEAEADDDAQDGPILPSSNTDEFRPFVRRLPEFKFWIRCMQDLFIALFCTLIPVLDLPVFWPVLVFYFITLLVLTMRQRIMHMIKYSAVVAVLGMSQEWFLGVIAKVAGGGDLRFEYLFAGIVYQIARYFELHF